MTRLELLPDEQGQPGAAVLASAQASLPSPGNRQPLRFTLALQVQAIGARPLTLYAPRVEFEL